MSFKLDKEWTDALGDTYQQIRYDLTKAVMEQVEAMREYQDELVLKNLPQDVLENFKRRIELELLRREKGDFDPEYTIAYYMWERERKEKGYLRDRREEDVS